MRTRNNIMTFILILVSCGVALWTPASQADGRFVGGVCDGLTYLECQPKLREQEKREAQEKAERARREAAEKAERARREAEAKAERARHEAKAKAEQAAQEAELRVGPKLRIAQHALTQSWGRYFVKGLITNESPYQGAPFVRVLVSFFDATGKLVDQDYTYVHGTGLPPGATDGFQVSVPVQDSIDSYTVRVTWR